MGRMNLLGLVAASFVAGSLNAMEVDTRVIQALRSNASNITVVVHLEGRADMQPFLKGHVQAQASNVVAALEQHHAAASRPLINALKARAPQGVKEITHLWAINSLRIKGTPDAIRTLLASNGVEAVELDAPKEMIETGTANASFAPRAENEVSWGVTKVRAPELWNSDGGRIDGAGVVVAVIDSGANMEHPDLKPNFWRNSGEVGLDSTGSDRSTNGKDDDKNGYIDDVYGWNFEEKSNNPEDVNGHGSQTAGIVGGNGAGGTQTGVAPGAKLMILRSCCNTGTEVFESNTWEAIQYAMKNGAHVISMSLSVKHPSKPSYAKWRQLGEVELASGIIHINSAGNRGSFAAPFNIGAPATNPPAWVHPSQPTATGKTSMITIGATDEDDTLRDYSSTGPVTWESIAEYKDYLYEKGAKPGLIKPEVCGPSEVPSTAMEGKGYTVGFGGTSSATPNVAGVAALVLSVKPGLTPAQMTEALQMSAVKVGEGYNNKCGAGRVDAVAAVEYAKARF